MLELGRRHEPIDEPAQPFGPKDVRGEGSLDDGQGIERGDVPARQRPRRDHHLVMRRPARERRADHGAH